MLIMCDSMKKSTFKERPENLLWYRLYRNEKLIIFKKKGENVEKALDVPEKPVCFQYCNFFYKVGNTFLNMKQVLTSYIKKRELNDDTYYLIIEFKNDHLMYLDLEDHSRKNVIEEQHKINVYVNNLRKGLI